MRVELGNSSPKDAPDLGACVTTMVIPDEYEFDPAIDLAALKTHLYDAVLTNGGITNFAGSQALISIVHPSGLWATHANLSPTWVDSDSAEFAAVLGTWFDCPVGKPADVEATHFTLSGEPGVGG